MKRFLIGFLAALAAVMMAALQAGFAETLSLPAGLTAVEDEAFLGDESLETVVLRRASGPSAAKPSRAAAWPSATRSSPTAISWKR